VIDPDLRLAVIGIGLIGASIARAASERGVAADIALYDADPAVRSRAAELGLGRVCDTAAEAASGAGIVVLCTPVGALKDAAASVAAALSPDAILTDVGSVKAAAARMLAEGAPGHRHILPGHPIAGTERSGPDAGFARLFEGRWCILTPPADADPTALARLEAFWAGLGSKVECMEATRHDLVLAVTSHVPHLIAFNIVATAADLETVTEGEVVTYSAGGFRDFTRIAASDPTMWRDVFLHNREAVLEVLSRFNEDLSALARAIRWGDGASLHAAFSRARGIRRSIIDAGQDTAQADFGRSANRPEPNTSP
jgi:cyclohexadieny/prephenate dehydrogenase